MSQQGDMRHSKSMCTHTCGVIQGTPKTRFENICKALSGKEHTRQHSEKDFLGSRAGGGGP